MRNKFVLTAVLLAFAGMATVGCYGPFNLTRKLHKWNGEVGSKWVQEGVFLCLVILPVYSFSSLADAIIFNSIQFWTGKNPITANAGGKEIKRLASGSSHALMSYSAHENSIELRMSKDGEKARYVRLMPQADGSMAALDQSGKIFMISRATPDGGIAVENSYGSPIAAYSSEEAEKILK